MEVEKKKRGKRGGAKRKEAASFTVTNVVPAASAVAPCMLFCTLINEAAVKKTRRGGQKVKQAIAAVPTNAQREYTTNSYPSVYSKTASFNSKSANYNTKSDSFFTDTPYIAPPLFPQLPHSLASYLLSLEPKLDTPFNEDDSEDTTILLSACFRELKGFEPSAACDIDASRVVEKLLVVASERAGEEGMQMVCDFADVLVESLELLAQHQYASHVTQTLVTVLSTSNLLPGLATVLSPNILTLASNQYASHTIRVLLHSLAGAPLISTATKTSTKFKSNNAALAPTLVSTSRVVSDEYTAALKALTAAFTLLSPSDLRKLSVDTHASPVLQLVCKYTPECDVAGALFEERFGRMVCKDRVGSHLVEAILESSPSPELVSKVYVLLSENIEDYCLDPFANFVLQKIILVLSTTEFTHLLQAITPHFPALLKGNKTGVVEKLFKRGIAHPPLQEHLYSSLTACLTPTPCLATAIASMNATPPPNSTTLNGALILQHLLAYPLFQSSLLTTLSTPTLLYWATHPTLSRVVETVFRTAALPAKWALIDAFTGHHASLACHRNASHILQAAWPYLDVVRKGAIAKELSTPAVAANRYGACVVGALKIREFDGAREAKSESLVEKKRMLFDELLPERGKRQAEVLVEGEVPIAKSEAGKLFGDCKFVSVRRKRKRVRKEK